MQLAREAAFRHFEATKLSDERKLSLKALQWSGTFDAPGDAAVRARFATLVDQLETLPDYERQSLRGDLIEAMAAYGYIEDAATLASTLSSQGLKDLVQGSLACAQVRRGDLRQAFDALKAIEDKDIAATAYSKVIQCIMRTANPELAHSAANYMTKSAKSADYDALTVALTEQRAGNATVARASAQGIVNDQWRSDVLFQLTHRYRRDADYPQAIAIDRLLLAEAVRLGNEQNQRTALEFLLSDLLDSRAPAPEIHALLAQVPGQYRATAYGNVFEKGTDPAVIREVGKRLRELTADERKPLEVGLLLARIRVGDLKAADALKLARDPHEMAEGLLRMSRSLGKDQQARAREVLQAAISALGPRQNLLWSDVAVAQAELGFLTEAHQTIDRKVGDPNSRFVALAGVSGVEALQGKAADAARSRAAAVQLLKPPSASNEEYPLADSLMHWGNPVQAQAELLVGLQKKLPGFDYRGKGVKVIKALTRQGDLRRAMDLARAISEYLQYSPEPFVDLHYEATGESGPYLY